MRVTRIPKDEDADWIPVVGWLRSGGIVVVPTETFYGLAVDPGSESAVEALFDLKGRPASAALPLIAASAAQVEARCGRLDHASRRIAERFWPGPVSLVLPVSGPIARAVLGDGETVAIRVPAHPIARAVAAAFGRALTATSANASGRPPARRLSDLDDLLVDPRVWAIDAGETPGGRPSTIIDARSTPPRLVRDGAVPWSRVLESLEG